MANEPTAAGHTPGPKETLWHPGQTAAFSNVGASHMLVPRADRGWCIP